MHEMNHASEGACALRDETLATAAPQAAEATAAAHAALVARCSAPTPRQLAAWPGLGGTLRTSPEDFVVEEVPAYLPVGAGDHLYLWLQKRDCAAPALLRCLAQALGVRERDVGVAGAKDAAAVTRQWVSVPRAAQTRLETPEAQGAFAAAGVTVLAAKLHGNKLRCGHLRGNRFALTVRGVDVARAEASLVPMLEALRSRGLANFYGPQRFGRDGQNVARGLAWLAGRRPAPHRGVERRFLGSAVQSAAFNDHLAARLADGLLHRVLDGELMQVVRSGGPFWADDPAVEQARYASREVVPTGPMFGPQMRAPRGEAGAREQATRERAGLGPEVFARAARLMAGTRRAMVVWPEELDATLDAAAATLTLRFVLPPGSYATVLTHELLGAAAVG